MLRSIFVPRKIAIPGRLRHLVHSGIFLLLFHMVALPQANAESSYTSEQDSTATALALPPSYGKVVYSYNENSSKKLYIVGINHRDSCSRLNGDNTAKTQSEVYRIGEWLNQNGKLDLILPEGYFDEAETSDACQRVRQSKPLGDNILEKKLADDSHYINAEMLMMEHLQMPASQVEDPWLYNAVMSRVVKLVDNTNNSASTLSLREEINCLQERRTAAILQKIPAVIGNKFHKGNIKSENAMFTIGMNHLGTIINYLKKNKIHIQSSPVLSALKQDYLADLNLIKEGFGIIIIIPNTLVVQDPDILKKSVIGAVASND